MATARYHFHLATIMVGGQEKVFAVGGCERDKLNFFQSHPVFMFLPFGIVTAEGPKIFISNSKFCRTNNLIDIA